MNRNEVVNELSAILSQFQNLCPNLTADNTDGQQADIDECTWRLSAFCQSFF